MDTEQYIDEIISIRWKLFTTVNFLCSLFNSASPAAPQIALGLRMLEMNPVAEFIDPLRELSQP